MSFFVLFVLLTPLAEGELKIIQMQKNKQAELNSPAAQVEIGSGISINELLFNVCFV